MPAGRPPKPTKVKELTGNPGKRKLNKREPKPAGGAPKCPAWLPETAKTEWKRIVSVLPPGLLTQADLAALVAYCTAWAALQEASKVLAREGRTFKTGTGYVQVHPAVAMQQAAWSAIKTFAAMFGLDPSSRSRLQLPPAEEEQDPFDAFLAGKKK